MLLPPTNPEQPNLKDQKGQTFLEFIFILLILTMMSFTFMKSFNYLIGKRWEAMLTIIARPNSIEFP